MGMGRLTKWTGKIQPFRDRPDIQMDVVWYPVPASNPVGPYSPFVDRFWEKREGFDSTGLVGTVVGSMKPYFGPVPGPAVTPLVGSDADWANGISYADYLKTGGNPQAACYPIPKGPYATKLKQTERLLWFGAGGPGLKRTRLCVNCPAGESPSGVLKVAGIADGTHPAAGILGSFIVVHDGFCHWVSAAFVPYPGGPSCKWFVMQFGAGATASLVSQTGDSTPNFSYNPVPGGCASTAIWTGVPAGHTDAFTFTNALLVWAPGQ